MRKLIGKIRRQPKQRRDNIAFGIASGFTFLIMAIWLFNVPNTFDGMLSASDSTEQGTGFFDKLSSQAAAVKESITAEGSATESLKDLMDEYRVSSTTASSTQSEPVSASSTATTTATTTPATPKESFERFTTDSAFESEKPRAVRIQAVAKDTTATTTSE